MPDRLAEERRVRALRDLEIVSPDRDPRLDQICALASDLFDVPTVLATLLDADHVWIKGSSGAGSGRVPREHAFCNEAVLGDKTLVVADAQRDRRFRANPFVSGAPHIRFYAGAPLVLEPGLRLGALCLLDTKPRTLAERDRRRLAQLASLAVAQIRLHGAGVALRDQASLLESRQSLLDRIASHDELTGLPNRTAFQAGLARAVASAGAEGTRAGLLVVDLDRLNHINDTLGHEAGDALLAEVARRLSTVVRPPGLLARLGGDEFGVLLPGLAGAGDLQAASDRILEVLREPASHRGQSLACSASVGRASFPVDAGSAAELLKKADMALLDAKGQGGNRAVGHRAEISERYLARLAALDRARDALQRDAVVPHYQPKVDLGSGRIVGFEALLRWHAPSLGLQGPATIWDAFGDPVLSVELGRRMLDRVLADMAAWAAQGVPFGSVAVNVSAEQFSDGCLAALVLDGLSARGLPPRLLELQVTETVVLGPGSERVGEALRTLNERGVAIALDDFGTGFASLTHLRQFPIRWLKIDRSFVGDVTSSSDAVCIVHTIIGLAQSLGIGVVAEGVETPEQLAFLTGRRCDVGQGYLFGRPMPADRVAGFIMDRDAHAGHPLRRVG